LRSTDAVASEFLQRAFVLVPQLAAFPRSKHASPVGVVEAIALLVEVLLAVDLLRERTQRVPRSRAHDGAFTA
jgi:hypothetical protein